MKSTGGNVCPSVQNSGFFRLDLAHGIHVELCSVIICEHTECPPRGMTSLCLVKVWKSERMELGLTIFAREMG